MKLGNGVSGTYNGQYRLRNSQTPCKATVDFRKLGFSNALSDELVLSQLSKS